MKFKELLKVIDSNAYLNIVSEKEHWLYEGKAIFITSDLLERTNKGSRHYSGGLINEHIWSISYSNICYVCDNND